MSRLIQIFQNIAAVKDEQGRPLREVGAPARALVGVPMELKVCEYSGSRYRHARPMNVSALMQMKEHWCEVMAGFDWLRALLLQNSAGSHGGLFGLWRIAVLGECLPAYLLFRGQEPMKSGELPGSVAAIYKIVLGLEGSLFRYMGEKLLAGEDITIGRVDPEELYAYIEDAGLFIGPTQVCAGPKSMILKLLQIMTQGDLATKGAGGPSNLVDQQCFWNYANHRMAYRLGVLLFETLDQLISAELIMDLDRTLAQAGESSTMLKMLRQSRAALLENTKLGFSPEKRRELPSRMGVLLAVIYPSQAGGISDALRKLAQTREAVGQAKAELMGKNSEIVPLAGSLAAWRCLETFWISLNQLTEVNLEASLGREIPLPEIGQNEYWLLFRKVNCHRFFNEALGLTGTPKKSCG